MRHLISGMILFFVLAPARPQPKDYNWATVQVPVEFSKHWQMLNEYSYRSLGESFSLYQVFLRAGARYVFNPSWNAGASFDYILTRTSLQKSNHEYGTELRPWQEVNYNLPLGNNFLLQNRVRVEERFFKAVSNKDAYTGFRFRYRAGCLKKFNSTWGLQLTNEYLEELEKKKLSFNQNRVFINTICQLDHTTQLQAGYYYVIRPLGQKQHIAVLTFQKRLIFYGRKQA